jgi:hypothetical protein
MPEFYGGHHSKPRENERSPATQKAHPVLADIEDPKKKQAGSWILLALF